MLKSSIDALKELLAEFVRLFHIELVQIGFEQAIWLIQTDT
jgi:hypothetical protein